MSFYLDGRISGLAKRPFLLHSARNTESEITFLPTEAPLTQASYLKKGASRVTRHLDRHEMLNLMLNRPLDLVSRPHETADALRELCIAPATTRTNGDKAAVTRKFKSRLRTVGWNYDKVTRIEEVSIGLEADDITVSEVRLVWIRGPRSEVRCLTANGASA